jgi:hypothetical protein
MWEKLTHAFALPDPAQFPALTSLTTTDRDTLGKYVAGCRKLASYSAIAHSSRFNMSSTNGNWTVTSEFPDDELLVAAAARFRQLNNQGEPTAFTTASDLVVKAAKVHDPDLIQVVAKWRKARGALLHRTIATIVCDMTLPEGPRPDDFPVSYGNLRPEDLFNTYFYALIGLNLVSLASLAISCSILGQGSVGLTDQHRGETSPSVAPGAVEEPYLATAALMSRPGSGAAVSAFTGGASSIGELSVPPSWATPAAIRQVVAALPSTAVPIVMQNSQTSPYTGMALAGLTGSSMAGLGFRGAPAASKGAITPAANKAPAATVVAANKPAPAAAPAATPPATPVAPKAAFPSAVPVAISAAGIPADVAANLAATLAGIPGATIIVIPPPPPSE